MEEIWTTNIGGWTKPPQGLILWTWQTTLATALYFHFMHCLSLISLISNPLIITLAYDYSIYPGLPPVHGFCFLPCLTISATFQPHFTPVTCSADLLLWMSWIIHFFFLVSTSSRVRSTKVNHTTIWDAVIHQRSMLIDTTNTIQCPPGFRKLSN